MELPNISVPYFTEQGFTRKQCKVTELWFWTRDESRETCGDTVEDEYTFIGNPIIKGFNERGKQLKDKMRETFLNYFEEKNHKRIDPYPVIARWRDDIHLTIASIADFQPHVTGGQVPPPANPLTISQPCIRLTDVDAVGRSGRHLTTFEMMAHHCFNRPKDNNIIYWIDECIRYCDDLFVNRLGIPSEQITYVENPWSGGGNAGPAVEVIAGGLELATLVFMNLEESSDGIYEIKGDKYREMDLQIIDTGYGLERFCWAAAGTPTIYEAIYPESISWLKELSNFESRLIGVGDLDIDLVLSEISKLSGILNIDVGTDVEVLYEILVDRLNQKGYTIDINELKKITAPLNAIYAIPDHLHALCNMLGDLLVPSNVKAGYLSRMMVRKTLKLMDELGIKSSLSELGLHHIEHHMDESNLLQTKERILEILELEEKRYREMLLKGESAVTTALKTVAKDAEIVDDEILFYLSESRGLQPDMVMEIAHRLGWNNLSVRVGFTAEMAARHAKQAKDEAKSKVMAELIPPELVLTSTGKNYYDDTSLKSFSADVISTFELTSEQQENLSLSAEVTGIPTHGVILDSTLFYPEGGGQLGDEGTLNQLNSSVNVLDTRVENDVIIHLTDGDLEVGKVDGILNWSRRKQLMDHHTAVHIVGGSAREILGPQIWQAGSNKGERNARIDLTHYRRLSRSDLDIIEDHANAIVDSNSVVTKLILDRAEADEKFGFELYQGGPPKHSQIRVIMIGEHDVQACAGTHHDNVGEIGEIRIIKSSAIQDGVERLQIVAGETAREHARHQERLLTEASEVLGVNPDDLPKSVKRFFSEWKSQQKTIEKLESEIVRLRTSGGSDAAVVKDGIRFFIMEGSGNLRNLQGMAKELTSDSQNPTVAVLGSSEDGGSILVAITEDSIASQTHDANEILKTIIPKIGGSGGGRPTFAQGGGTNPSGLTSALDQARDILLN